MTFNSGRFVLVRRASAKPFGCDPGKSALVISNLTFFAVSKAFWDGLSDSERKAIETAEDEAKKFNDEGVKKTEAEAVAFLQGKGVKVVTPDVAAFRKQVQEKFAGSDFAKTWPAGMLDRINKAGT